MFGVTILNELFLSTNIIFLGIFGMTIESGYFAIALKITLLSNIFLQILNSTLSPKIAILFKHKKIKELNKLLQESTIISCNWRCDHVIFNRTRKKNTRDMG